MCTATTHHCPPVQPILSRLQLRLPMPRHTRAVQLWVPIMHNPNSPHTGVVGAGGAGGAQHCHHRVAGAAGTAGRGCQQAGLVGVPPARHIRHEMVAASSSRRQEAPLAPSTALPCSTAPMELCPHTVLDLSAVRELATTHCTGLKSGTLPVQNALQGRQKPCPQLRALRGTLHRGLARRLPQLL